MRIGEARILVADDQVEVARTLCRSLEKAGSRLTFVDSGVRAVRELEKCRHDLVILDMKMPPGDWGGLAVLDHIRSRGITIPVLVLSGEGGRQPLKDAMGLGASGWVDKDLARIELLPQCEGALQRSMDDLSEAVSTSLPRPLAHVFVNYFSAETPEQRGVYAFQALQETLRFVALVGWSEAALEGDLGNASLRQADRPTLGVWLNAVASNRASGPAFGALRNAVIADGNLGVVQKLVKLRNSVAHHGTVLSSEDHAMLRTYLSGVAHRLARSWQWTVVVVTSLDFDRVEFTNRVRPQMGLGRTSPLAMFATPGPLVTGGVYLLREDCAIDLSPWIVVAPQDGENLWMFDGISRSGSMSMTEGSPIYSDPVGGKGDLRLTGTDASWIRVRELFA